MMNRMTLIWIAASATAGSAFMVNPASRAETRLFLEDRIAELIDKELYRQGHKKDFEKEWMEKNRGAVLHSLGGAHGADDHESLMLGYDDNAADFRQHKKDLNMAVANPERYCADRCVATGNCDIFEDFYHLSPEQVLNFCEECVLADEGECDLPNDFYEVGKLMP
uniref:Uncharacterized protein n=1 Tax=Amphora coffeiformis TaxID=265554 RepID=A0A7S3L3U0_9STRA